MIVFTNTVSFAAVGVIPVIGKATIPVSGPVHVQDIDTSTSMALTSTRQVRVGEDKCWTGMGVSMVTSTEGVGTGM